VYYFTIKYSHIEILENVLLEIYMAANLREEIHRLHAQLCSALADPNRIFILYTLITGAFNVSELAKEVGLPQPTVSRHLKVLRESGLLIATREGHSMIYQLADGRVIEALDILRAMLADNLEKQAALAQTASENLSLVN
jgi:ArsR family transcriptional regulator